jgi:hypothetical protein
MQAGLRKERSIVGDGQASVTRGQISVAISQIAIDADQLHNSVQSSQQDFDLKAGQLLQQSKAANRACAEIQASKPNTFGNQKDLVAACTVEATASNAFSGKAAALQAAFTHIEGVWTSEHAAQDDIERSSDQAVQ